LYWSTESTHLSKNRETVLLYTLSKNKEEKEYNHKLLQYSNRFRRERMTAVTMPKNRKTSID